MYYHRDIEKKIYKNIENDYILIVVGARQTGKTTLLKHIQTELDDSNKTYFFNLEDLDYLNSFNDSPKNLINMVDLSENRIFVFIDEVQYLDNPTNFLKYIYDEYKEKIKLIVSGSSAFYINKKFKDSLAGRKRLFWLDVLNFSEILRFHNEENLRKLYCSKDKDSQKDQEFPLPIKRRLDKYWNNYQKFGGYPRVVLAKDSEEKTAVLKELMNSFIKKDIEESGITKQDKFLSLLKILSSQIGGLLNKNRLSNILDISNTAIDSYLFTMRKSFHISLVNPFFKNMRKELRKMPKVYFHDIGFRNILIKNFNELEIRNDKGQLFENIIYKVLLSRYEHDQIKFWRTQDGNEVDFVIEDDQAIEVKYNINNLKTYKYNKFLSNYDLPLKFVYREGNIKNAKIHSKEEQIRFSSYLKL